MINAENGFLVFSNSDFTCRFDRDTGVLLSISNGRMEVSIEKFLLDVGCDGRFVLGTIEYQDLDPLNTWELPSVIPNPVDNVTWDFTGFEEEDDVLSMYYCAGHLKIAVFYKVECNTLSISSRVTNMAGKRSIINGMAFVLTVDNMSQDTTFEFPANVPHNVFRLGELKEFQAVEAGLVNPIIHTQQHKSHFNLVFVDCEEKWATGVFREKGDCLTYIYMPAVESYLEPEGCIECGNLYIQLVGEGDPYGPIRDLYQSKGWVPPTDGISEGILYSCHPYGTMDANFPYKQTLTEYAQQMEAIRKMGVDHIWVLPLFEHLDRNVYGPTDMRIIDQRYGGDEGVRVFSRKVHDLGMTLLFDYVPHGPKPQDDFGKQHMEWAAVDRNGVPKEEWKALSFDMANPDYQKFITNLVRDHVRRFDIDGSRIDCAMGGLSNWRPYPGNRPSNSNLKGGVSISRAIREGFTAEGKRPLVLPENFNPVPCYYPYTDVFYDMAFYRVLVELDQAKLDPEEFVSRLTHWLDTEMKCTPKELCKLRFLGNHDTVTWVWQAARPVDVYGVDRAKALWAFITFIDGMPMIYQGDEDPAIYKKDGPVLRGFFKEIFTARKEWLGNQYDIKYLYTNTPIMAFIRSCQDKSRLVLINISGKQACCSVGCSTGKVVFGQCRLAGPDVTMPAYGYAILDI